MGGHVDPDEPAHSAALREGAEESGLGDLELVGTGVVDLDVHPIPEGKGEPGHSHFDVRYVARTLTPDAIMIADAESKELLWVDLDRALTMMSEEGSRRVITKIRKML